MHTTIITRTTLALYTAMTIANSVLAQNVTPNWNSSAGTAYVSNGGDASGNGGSLSLLDLANLHVRETLPLGGAPVGVVLNRSRNRIYVANSASNFAWVVSADNLRVLAKAATVASPINLALTPDGAFLYATSGSSGAVSVTDTETNSLVATISIPTQRILSIAITPDGRLAYATDCCSDNNVTVIDTRTNTVVTQIPLAGGPSGIAITPDGRFAFVEDLVDTSIIDTHTNQIVDTIPGAGGCGPSVVLTPDGTRAYVANYCGNTVSVIDTSSQTLVTTLTTNTPIGEAFAAQGGFVLFVNNNCVAFPCTVPGTVSILKTSDYSLAATATVGLNPQEIVIAPALQ